MSAEYMPSKRIAFERIKHFSYGGVTAKLEDGNLLLTDGASCLWVYPACKGRRVTFIRQGDNDVERIIEVMEAYFRVWLVSEYEDEFFEIIRTERRIARRLKAAKKAKTARKEHL
jgi:hypothetical protein